MADVGNATLDEGIDARLGRQIGPTDDDPVGAIERKCARRPKSHPAKEGDAHRVSGRERRRVILSTPVDSGGGFHAAMVLAHSSAAASSVTPGKSRRNSTAAANSPRCSKAARMAAASASVTANMPAA